MTTTIVSLQSARIDAANVLADADARCRNANHPESNSSDEERSAAHSARAIAQTQYDETVAALSAEQTAQRLAYEDAWREDREADAAHWIMRQT